MTSIRIPKVAVVILSLVVAKKILHKVANKKWQHHRHGVGPCRNTRQPAEEMI